MDKPVRETYRLACYNCDRGDFDMITKLPDDWQEIDFVQSFESACQERGFSDDPGMSCLDWFTHLGMCPDCVAEEAEQRRALEADEATRCETLKLSRGK